MKHWLQQAWWGLRWELTHWHWGWYDSSPSGSHKHMTWYAAVPWASLMANPHSRGTDIVLRVGPLRVHREAPHNTYSKQLLWVCAGNRRVYENKEALWERLEEEHQERMWESRHA